MAMLEVSANIASSAAVAWRLLTDTHAWPQWGPSVRAVDAPTRVITAGTRGRVQTTVGLWVPFEITDWGGGHLLGLAGRRCPGDRSPRDARGHELLSRRVYDPALGAVLRAGVSPRIATTRRARDRSRTR